MTPPLNDDNLEATWVDFVEKCNTQLGWKLSDLDREKADVETVNTELAKIIPSTDASGQKAKKYFERSLTCVKFIANFTADGASMVGSL